jgi:hypothetical protein
MIDYYLKSAPKDEITLDILDSQGKVVRHISSKEKDKNEQPPEWPDRVEKVKTIPANEGMNRFAWDLRLNDPIQVPGAFYGGEGPRGPLAIPGDYQVKLTVAGKSQTAPLHLVIDPRMKGSEPQVEKNFAFAVQVNDRISQLHQAINEIRELKGQVKSLHQRLGESDKTSEILKAADDAAQKMSSVEEQLIQVNAKGSEATLAFPSMLNERFDSLSHVIESDHEPTQGQSDMFKLLSEQLDAQLQKWAQIKAEDVPKVNALTKQLDLPVLNVSEPKKP